VYGTTSKHRIYYGKGRWPTCYVYQVVKTESFKNQKGKPLKKKVLLKIAKINQRHKTAFRELNFCLMSVWLMFWPPTLPTSPTRVQVAELLLEPLTKHRKYYRVDLCKD